MKVPVEITYRNVPKTEDIEALVRTKVEKLERVCDYISSCRVAIEKTHQRHHTGNSYHVRIDLTVPPGKELVVNREPGPAPTTDELPGAIRFAFDAARRQLQELVERQRGDVKVHPEQQMAGVIVRLLPDRDCGFIKTLDGRDVYFHRNSLLNEDFDRLEVGVGVHFAEEMGAHGLQASTVRVVDKPGARLSKSEEPLPEPPLGWGD